MSDHPGMFQPTTSTQSPAYQLPADTPLPPTIGPPPKRPRKLWPWIAGVVLSGVIVGVGAIALAGGEQPQAEPAAQSEAPRTRTQNPFQGASCDAPGATGNGPDGVELRCDGVIWRRTTPEPPPPPPPAEPKPADFKLTLKIMRKQCFGSAGCNVTYRVEVAYGGEPFTGVYLVTYEVRGGQDGPVINSLTVEGDQASVPSEEIIPTPSSRTKLTVHVTSVSAE